MSRRVMQPVTVEVGRDGAPKAVNRNGVLYRVRVIGRWCLRDRWWDEQRHSNREYFRSDDQRLPDLRTLCGHDKTPTRLDAGCDSRLIQSSHGQAHSLVPQAQAFPSTLLLCYTGLKRASVNARGRSTFLSTYATKG